MLTGPLYLFLIKEFYKHTTSYLFKYNNWGPGHSYFKKVFFFPKYDNFLFSYFKYNKCVWEDAILTNVILNLILLLKEK